MLDIQQRFISFYFNTLRGDPMFINMGDTFEGSMWHRESNVLLHTDMVVTNYVHVTATKMKIDEMFQHTWLLGAFACAFHDVGKPAAEETRFSEERGTYRRYAGHEMISSRLWEDWAVKNWSLIIQFFPEFTARAITQVGWIIQNHLPFSLKDSTKVSRLVNTADAFVGIDIFAACLEADCRGRISDDHDTKLSNTLGWIDDVLLKCDNNSWVAPTYNRDDKPQCIVLVGPSGSGKSTFTAQRIDGFIQNNQPYAVHSMDQLRHEWYGADYNEAFRMSTEDHKFKSRVHEHFMNIIKSGKHVIVDNTNTSTKSRGFYVQEARKKGYELTAAVFPVSLDQIIRRQSTRGDKCVPVDAVTRQYNNLQLPFYGEFDYINVVDSNLYDK